MASRYSAGSRTNAIFQVFFAFFGYDFSGGLIEEDDFRVLFLLVRHELFVPSMFVNPAVGGVPDNSQQPGPALSASETAESLKCPQVGLLHDILRVLVVLDNPTRQIVSGIQKRQENLFKLPPFFSHHSMDRKKDRFIPAKRHETGDADVYSSASMQGRFRPVLLKSCNSCFLHFRGYVAIRTTMMIWPSRQSGPRMKS